MTATTVDRRPTVRSVKTSAVGTSASAQSALMEQFVLWLSRFVVDKAIDVKDIFRALDHQVVIDPSLAWAVARAGVRADGMVSLIRLLDLPSRDSVAELVGASNVSMWRWIKDKKALPGVHTEQILRAMEMQILATEVFGTVSKAQAWLGKPHPSLEALAPRDYASNEYGAQKVRGMLAALRYGGVA